MADAAPPAASSWTNFWQIVTRFEAGKMSVAMAARNAIGVVIPLVLGALLGSPGGGVVGATGALNVAFSDGHDAYSVRAFRMFVSSLVCGVAVIAGGLSGHSNPGAVAVAIVWAFASGMLVALGSAAGDIGVISLVTLVVFAAQPMTPEKALQAGLIAMGGGLLQTALAISLWPLRRYQPERKVVEDVYAGLARAAATFADPETAPPISAQMSAAQETVAGLAQDHSDEAENYVFLLNQAERIRLSILTLGRLRRRIEREPDGTEPAACIGQALDSASQVLADRQHPGGVEHFGIATEALRALLDRSASAATVALLSDAVSQIDALAGQLRAITAPAQEILEPVRTPVPGQHWRVRMSARVAKLRANLSLDSTVFRHALRLAVCAGLGDAIGRGLSLHRTYWIPMTIAIVLKPDFSSTFSRGILRLAGTLAGLAAATVMFRFFHTGVDTDIALICIVAFLLRWVGSANYGIFTILVSAAVVLLLATVGVNPKDVISARAVNTFAGGLLALAAYWVWPTWERYRTGESLASMLNAYRAYLRGVFAAYGTQNGPAGSDDLEGLRLKARLARSNAEASVDRIVAEPGTTPEQSSVLSAILASAHRFVHAVMALESGLYQTRVSPARQATREFELAVEQTLEALSEILRSPGSVKPDFPDLRQAHKRILQSGETGERYALVNVETDRIANSLNTLREQIVKWR